jgi:thiol-disulfide isomerase/thioredoxin
MRSTDFSWAAILMVGVVLGITAENQLRRTGGEPRPSADQHTSSAATAELQPAAQAVVGTPKLVVVQPEFNFGEEESGDKIDHTFLLKNVGTAPLKITKVKAACHCTATKLSRDEIAPGQEVELNATLNLSLQKGPQNREILVQTNDPVTPDVTLTFVGTAVPRAKVDPARVDVGNVEGADPVSKTFKVTGERGLEFKIVNTRTSDEAVAAEVKVVTPGKEYEITVTVKPPLAEDWHGWVHLITDQVGEYHVIGVPVIAHAGGTPATLQADQAANKARPASSSARAQQPPPPALTPGEAFVFSGPTAEGANLDDSQFKGKPVVVAFWASWCGVCKQEIPKLLATYQKYHPEGLEIVGINMDHDQAAMQRYVDANKIPCANIYFAEGSSAGGNPLAQRYKVRGIPRFIVIDRDGKVVRDNARGSVLDDAIQSALGQKVATTGPASTGSAPTLAGSAGASSSR